MKKIMLILIILISIIFIDSIQAIIFKRNPIMSIRYNNLADEDSYVYKGIIMNTYYCVKEKDIVTVKRVAKLDKYSCPVE